MESSDSSSSPTTSLPDEIVFEILSKLPVKTLIRFLTVCKSWRKLISSDPIFCRAQLHNYYSGTAGGGGTKTKYALVDLDDDCSINAPPLSCVCHRRRRVLDNRRLKEFTTNFLVNSGEDHHDHRWRLIFKACNFKFAGCCNGVVCLYRFCNYGKDLHIYLWNPALNQCGVLPESKYISCKKLDHHSHMLCFLHNAAGDGDDYRVVKMVYLDGFGSYKGEIYSLSDNSWKPIVFSESCPHKKQSRILHSYHWDTVVHHGLPHWLAIANGVPSFLCALDMKSNQGPKIREISLPEEVYKDEDAHLQLFEGRVSIFSGLTRTRPEKFEVWVMKEGEGENVNWIKKIVVLGELEMRLLHHRTTTWKIQGSLFAAGMEEFVGDRWGRRLVLYDAEDQRVIEKVSQDDLVFDDLPNYSYVVADYVPSLISLASLI